MDTFKRNTQALASQQFDVCIVGGGISGAWLALHCAQSGLTTALIEKGDFASQTSSSSSKLLHGGIRYLQQFQFGKVRESAIERAHYIYAAPHLSTAVPFAVPTYRDFQRSKTFLRSGMLAYKSLCFGEDRIIESREEHLPPITSISSSGLNEICELEGNEHTGAVVFYERHMLNSERMVLSILRTAASRGAQVVNYVEAQNYLREADRITGVRAKDMLTQKSFDLNATLVINAAGPWIDSLNSDLKSVNTGASITAFFVGSHIITRKISSHAIALTTKHKSNAKIDRGGRHIFVIPWRNYSLIGTSYDEIDSAQADLLLQTNHVEQLLEVINQQLPQAQLTSDDLISGYSGLYPLRTDNIQPSVYQGSGEYHIIDHFETDGVNGLITALGAKYTTGRKLSALTMKVVDKKLNRSIDVAKTKLLDADYHSLKKFTATKVKQYQETLDEPTIKHLISHYGSSIDGLIDHCQSDPLLLEKICSTECDILGQASWAIENEQAKTLSDVIFRRTSVGLLGISPEELRRVAELMANNLAWSTEKTQSEIDVNQGRLNKTKDTLAAAEKFL